MEPFFLFLAIVIFYIVRGAVRSQGGAGIDPHDRPPDESGLTSERMVEAQERALAALQRWEARQGLGEGTGRRTSSVSRERRDYRESSSPLRIREVGPESSSPAPLREDRRQAYAEIARLLDPERRPARPAPGPAEARPVADGREAPRAAVEGRRLRRSRRDSSPIDSESAAVPTPRDRQSPLARLERLPLPVRAIVYAEILQRPHRR